MYYRFYWRYLWYSLFRFFKELTLYIIGSHCYFVFHEFYCCLFLLFYYRRMRYCFWSWSALFRAFLLTNRSHVCFPYKNSNFAGWKIVLKLVLVSAMTSLQMSELSLWCLWTNDNRWLSGNQQFASRYGVFCMISVFTRLKNAL